MAMTWEVRKSGSCPRHRPWGIYSSNNETCISCHATEQEAQMQAKVLEYDHYEKMGKSDGS